MALVDIGLDFFVDTVHFFIGTIFLNDLLCYVMSYPSENVIHIYVFTHQITPKYSNVKLLIIKKTHSLHKKKLSAIPIT